VKEYIECSVTFGVLSCVKYFALVLIPQMVCPVTADMNKKAALARLLSETGAY
jgi:hypothetical protein